MGSADYLSLIALLVSMVTGALTIRVYRRGIEIQTYQRVTELFLKLNDVFIEYPEVRPYFYENLEIPSAADSTTAGRVTTIAEHMLDIFDWILHDCEGASDVDSKSWRSYIGDMFQSSTILNDFHLAHPEWHPVLHAQNLHNGNARLGRADFTELET